MDINTLSFYNKIFSKECGFRDYFKSYHTSPSTTIREIITHIKYKWIKEDFEFILLPNYEITHESMSLRYYLTKKSPFAEPKIP